ncbi:MAG: IS110 family transposase [Caldilineaceae bacterium]|nr:IS110 family transposase [Caldilineaceae bacterium]
MPKPRELPFVQGGEKAEEELRHYHPRRVLLVALDIGKDVHHLYIRTVAGDEIVAPRKLVSVASGYQELLALLDEFLAKGDYDLVLVGHEPTGVYHEAWSHALAERYHAHRIGEATPALRYRLVNPTLVKQERHRKSHRHRKTDAIDVSAIAALLAIGSGNPVLLLDETAMRLRVLLGQLRRDGKAQLRLGIQVRTTLDRMWPGALGNSKAYRKAHPTLPPLQHLVESRPLERQTVRVLFEHCPNPYELRALGAAGIRQLFHTHGAPCGPKTAARIHAIAQQSLLPPPVMVAILADQLQADFALYRTYETRLAGYEAAAATLLAGSSAACLLTFPGIGHTLVTRYLAGLVDPARFTKASQIWSFAGFDPLLAETGNVKRKGKISYKGCPYLRNTLFQIGFMAAQHCPVCRAAYQRALRHHPSTTRATIHVANKANRILFALWREQQPYSLELARRQ